MRPFRVDSSTKKDQERRLFEQFCRLNPELKLRLSDQPDPPAADVLADLDGRVIAIEMMRYLSSERKNKSNQKTNPRLSLQGGTIKPKTSPGLMYESRGLLIARVASRTDHASHYYQADFLAKFVAKRVPPVGAPRVRGSSSSLEASARHESAT